ncbi:MAG: isoaspartyl peptidase, partial [Clostridia bacterium]|nr:isoaspartyl peptidase [Clostridia bacterium]
MRYICRKRFKGKCLGGTVNIPYGATCEAIGNTIIWNNKPICLTTSENAYQHFARDDDGHGTERGKAIQTIMDYLKAHKEGWTNVWNDLSLQRFKKPNLGDHWLWNHAFYNATMQDLAY